PVPARPGRTTFTLTRTPTRFMSTLLNQRTSTILRSDNNAATKKHKTKATKASQTRKLLLLQIRKWRFAGYVRNVTEESVSFVGGPRCLGPAARCPQPGQRASRA